MLRKNWINLNVFLYIMPGIGCIALNGLILTDYLSWKFRWYGPHGYLFNQSVWGDILFDIFLFPLIPTSSLFRYIVQTYFSNDPATYLKIGLHYTFMALSATFLIFIYALPGYLIVGFCKNVFGNGSGFIVITGKEAHSWIKFLLVLIILSTVFSGTFNILLSFTLSTG